MNRPLLYMGKQVRMRSEKLRGHLKLRQDEKHRLTLYVPDGVTREEAQLFLDGLGSPEGSSAQIPLQQVTAVIEELTGDDNFGHLQVMWMDHPKYWGQMDWEKQEVRLNRLLLRTSVPCICAVLCHELCHLAEHEHTPLFWSRLRDMMPDWALWEGKLRGIRWSR